MTKDLNYKQFANQQGSVLVELTLILPIILVISLTVFEYTRAIQRLSIATSASKEFANIIKRNCRDKSNECLNAERVRFETFLHSVVKDIRLRVYAMEPRTVPGGFIFDRVAYSQGDNTPVTRIDKFILSSDSGSTLQGGFSPLGRHHSVIFTECYVPFSPLITFVNSIFNLPFVNEHLYDATII